MGLFLAIGLSACDINNNEEYQSCGTYGNTEFSNYPLECNYTIKETPAEAKAIAIKTQAQMDLFVTKNNTSCGDSSIPETINFENNYLIGIFAGTKPTTGYTIQISSILENNCEIVIQFYETEPADGADVESTLNNPHSFVLIPKTNKPIYLNKVSKPQNYIVLGTYSNLPTQTLYSETDINVLHYLNVPYGIYDISNLNFESLSTKGEYSQFVKTIPNEILALNGQTKTYGSPNVADQGGIYFQLNKGGITTTVFIDTYDTNDQSADIITFKKAILARIDSY